MVVSDPFCMLGLPAFTNRACVWLALAASLTVTVAAPASAATAGSGVRASASAKARKAPTHRRSQRHSRPKPQPRQSNPIPAANPPASLAAPCPDATLMPAPDNLERVRAATMCLVNQERAKQGLGALTASPVLHDLAASYVGTMLAQGFFSHTAPSGQGILDRFRAVGYVTSTLSYYRYGENLGYGFGSGATPQSVVTGWMGSPPHRAQILTEGYREAGIGVAMGLPSSVSAGEALPGLAGSVPYGTTFAQEFAARSR